MIDHVGTMRLPKWASRLLLALAAIIVLAGAVLVVVDVESSNNPTGRTVAKSASIPTPDGVSLAASVASPRGQGPFPLVVMPASWGAPATEYHALAADLVSRGYQVVAYAERGFQGSGGEIDFGGAATQRDVSTVIDWALQHTHADPKHIGLFGISLGGGMSLLAAAHDRRVKAVVATSAWTDLLGALAPHGTLDRAGLGGLFANPKVVAALDPQTHRLAADTIREPSRALALLTAMSRSRSAVRELGALARNHPAIMIANAFEDSLFDPSPLIPFFERLHTPKRLELATGDHTGPEWPALYGRRDATFATATRWLDHYLKGVDNGIDRAPAVSLEDGVDGSRHTYARWPSSHPDVLGLGAPNVAGDLGRHVQGTWSRTTRSGADSGADVGGTSDLARGLYEPASISIDALRPGGAFAWSAAPVATTRVLSGVPTLRVQLSAARPVTLYAYLYEVDPSGTATLMSYAPATAPSGELTMALRPLSWTVLAGDGLELVLDTADPHFAAAGTAATTFTLSSPASLTVPG
jgi:predicted acyl esterase